ncbi:MAG: hypothetical protein GY739_09910 [Mesoflavibacter sp.]|nr:hypothetical protein [Mesoflavibacter sp.]
MKKQDCQYPKLLQALNLLNENSKIVISLTNNSIHYDTHKVGWHCPERKLVANKIALEKLNKVFNQNDFFKKSKDTAVYCIFDPERISSFEEKLTDFLLLVKNHFVKKKIVSLKDRLIVLPTPPRHQFRCCPNHSPVSRKAAEKVTSEVYCRVAAKINSEAKAKFVRIDSNDKFMAYILISQNLDELLTERQKDRFFAQASKRSFVTLYHQKAFHTIIYKKILARFDNYTHFKTKYNHVLSEYIKKTLSSSFNPVREAKKKCFDIHKDAKAQKKALCVRKDRDAKSY